MGFTGVISPRNKRSYGWAPTEITGDLGDHFVSSPTKLGWTCWDVNVGHLFPGFQDYH